MTKERLKLVTDFAELRAGMIVVAGPCGQCGRKGHRAVLLLRERAFVDRRDQDAWNATPEPHGPGFCVTEGNVEHRLIHRVIDGLEDDARKTTAKPEQLENVR